MQNQATEDGYRRESFLQMQKAKDVSFERRRTFLKVEEIEHEAEERLKLEHHVIDQ